jgi:hypothetical protein
MRRRKFATYGEYHCPPRGVSLRVVRAMASSVTAPLCVHDPPPMRALLGVLVCIEAHLRDGLAIALASTPQAICTIRITEVLSGRLRADAARPIFDGVQNVRRALVDAAAQCPP